ncbi:Transposase [Cordylochernes scorpioides]|uniref:Transposase n=1 Tax=Cordylochernes scorpioides TaxID=51811 RepID=A0ABY6K1P6_9ARAC|nr:Transposase [Cordylochernes scorpioides]
MFDMTQGLGKLLILEFPGDNDAVAALRPYRRVVSLTHEIVSSSGYTWTIGNREACGLVIISKGESTPAYITYGDNQSGLVLTPPSFQYTTSQKSASAATDSDTTKQTPLTLSSPAALSPTTNCSVPPLVTQATEPSAPEPSSIRGICQRDLGQYCTNHPIQHTKTPKETASSDHYTTQVEELFKNLNDNSILEQFHKDYYREEIEDVVVFPSKREDILEFLSLGQRSALEEFLDMAIVGEICPTSGRTISRRLVANGLHSCRPLRRLPLTPPNRRQRLEWCRARSTWMTEWHRVVFSDESRFCLSSDSRRVRVWRRRGERFNPAAIVERPTVRQRRIMVWGPIVYDSRSPLLRIQGTMTAQRYVDDVLRPVTLPYLQGVPNALYQQDNARPHTARISQQALQDVQMLPWPPYSPDLSPIEHVWDIIGRRLHALPQPRSEDELWQMLEKSSIFDYKGTRKFTYSKMLHS